MDKDYYIKNKDNILKKQKEIYNINKEKIKSKISIYKEKN